MFNIDFYKYQGCGNDFIIVDNRIDQNFFTKDQIQKICDRRFGIGGDGFMILESCQPQIDFEMKYYNSDGNASTFCGNGGRCMVKFAHDLGILKSRSTNFYFDDEIYRAEILENGLISLDMHDVDSIIEAKDYLELNTGSPHYIRFVDDTESFDLIPFAKKIRYSSQYPVGINVNIVEEISKNKIRMRTYERGVEDETLSCGTGVTAAAISYHQLYGSSSEISVKTKGGDFIVRFHKENLTYSQIQLIAPAVFVFKGSIAI